MTTCDLVTIFQKSFFNLNIKSFDLVTLCNLVTFFAETKSVNKSRLYCMYIKSKDLKTIQISSSKIGFTFYLHFPWLWGYDISRELKKISIIKISQLVFFCSLVTSVRNKLDLHHFQVPRLYISNVGILWNNTITATFEIFFTQPPYIYVYDYL